MQLFTLFVVLFFSFCDKLSAATITQCTQPDGTIEFTNQGCSKSNSYNSKTSFNRYSTHSLVSKTRKKNKKRSAPFRQADFIHLQNKLLKAETIAESEQHAQLITNKIRKHAQSGKLKSAYDMIAATYVTLSRDMKKKRWEGQKINTQTLKMQRLFEEILITQSTISTSNELHQAIESAWKKHQSRY